MKRSKIIFLGIFLGVALVVALLSACGGGGGAAQDKAPVINPADFQARVDNPLFPLSLFGLRVFEGQEADPESGETIKTRLESRVLPTTEVVAGVEVLVLEEKEYENGELVERTLDFFAQHIDGTVYYFGERVDDYEDGKVVSHKGQWLAGQGKNQPGVFMPANPRPGQMFEQEIAPGIAEDESTVVALDATLTTRAGSFSGCLKTEDFDPIGDSTEFKFYCPGVGFVREEGENKYLEVTSY